jgi:hypothetical protein
MWLHFTLSSCYSTKEFAEEAMANLKHDKENQGSDWYVPNYYQIETLFLDK